MAYRVLYAQQFHNQMVDLPDSIYDRVEHSIDILSESPGLARDYNPQYEAAYPLVLCKWYFVPRTYKVIYLTVDHSAEELHILYLGDTRENPMSRFDRMDYL